MQLHDLLIAPFAEFAFMRRALAGSIALAIAGPPLGVFLILRRMALTGDAMAHAILPGAALGYLAAGLSLGPMTIGGLAAGLIVAVGSGVVARTTILREDASLAAFYLISLALGVTIVSLRGSNIDLLHVLFGSVLALDDATLILLAAIASVTLAALAALYRPLVLETVDASFLASVSKSGGPVQIIFLALVVLNLVGGFHALGTLARGRHDDAARGFGKAYHPRHDRDDRSRGGAGHTRGLCRARRLLSRRPAIRSADYSNGGPPVSAGACVRPGRRPSAPL